ncbi:MAG: LPS assembly lipoprotein LptE [Alphaproteobacteria bacterium]|jgi:LPS-assembly lipoprotein|nr:LPS assembly lipoprotein LptE [Alphaproteobacteria bacterium]
MSLFRGQFSYCSRTLILCALAVGLLSACGFQPLHGRSSGGQGSSASGSTISDMAYVQVAPIADRVGQLVRDRLLDRMHPRGLAAQPVFRLTVVLRESREGLAFQQDDSATRFNLRLSASFKLTDTRDGAELLQGTARAIAAYNVVRSDYANLISKRDARRRAAHNVAEGIQDRIAVYFLRRRG